MMRSVFVVVTLLAIASPASAGVFSGGGGGSAAQVACRDDAYKFCAGVIRDVAKRRACMGQHLSQLSPGCRAAIGH